MKKRAKGFFEDLASYGLDTAVSILANGIPIPATLALKQLHHQVNRSASDPDQLKMCSPSLQKYLANRDTEFLTILSKKLLNDFTNSYVGDRGLIYSVRKQSQKRFEFLKETYSKKIYLPISTDLFIQDAKLNESLGYSAKDLVSLNHMKENERLYNEIKKRKKKIRVSVSSVCAANVAVLLSLKERYNLDIEVNFHYANARNQMQMILFENDKNIDYIFTANSTFLFHSKDLLEEQNKWTLLKELHFENQFLMKNPNSSRFSKSKDFVSVFSDSTTEEQYYLDRHQIRSKIHLIEDFNCYPNNNDNFAFAWEPLIFFLESKGWKKLPETRHSAIFSLFGKGINYNSYLNKYFVELFCREWLFCSHNPDRAFELLISRPDFVKKFKIGSGLG